VPAVTCTPSKCCLQVSCVRGCMAVFMPHAGIMLERCMGVHVRSEKLQVHLFIMLISFLLHCKDIVLYV
jgi:hypothetical protein